MNASSYSGTPPITNEQRKIESGPIYSKPAVITLSKQKLVVLWTRDARNNASDLLFDTRDVADLITLAVNDGRFLGSEWCQQTSNGLWAACDSYEVKRLEWNERTQKKVRSDYFLKFAISKTRTTLFSVSNHLST